ncbi:type II toxin-antitoxin system RelE/ParE family toxin [Aureimonas altamirensis]|uniref:type II toxin-antitoxin system RelE/ParE family toxin n=1 Tax=Aureimonas altamirensis TaxID=370622 RepID=UPI0025556223|nr:type II toxin-antitoxin system RelE/ParE family toxin [Aureimonas altamirensis]
MAIDSVAEYRGLLDFAAGENVCEFQCFERQAWKRLEILDAAISLAELGQLPSNRLEGLKGGRSGQFSIRIDLKGRICFEWPADSPGPSMVELVDYH